MKFVEPAKFENNDAHMVDRPFQKHLIIVQFENPPRKNLCFSNVIASCVLNIPPLRQFLKENTELPKDINSICSELSLLLKQPKNILQSTKTLRTIVMNRCLESGQLRNFNNNMQFDCVEFLQSLLEHLWMELPLSDNLSETVFGGLFCESYQCECGQIEEHPIQILPTILSVPIVGETVQTCFDAYISSEQVVRTCQNCQSVKSCKSTEIITPPSTLILHLKRFSYNEINHIATKLHVPVQCPLNLNLKGADMYYLNSVINHLGESLTSGHYTIVLNDTVKSSFVLIDDEQISYDVDVRETDEVSYVVIYTRL